MTLGMAERVLIRLPAAPLNFAILARRRLQGRRPLVHHGLQRSGTNFVNACLRRIGASPINAFDPPRSSPRHKHCRWQPEKDSIPSFIRDQYGSRFEASDLRSLDRIAGFPADSRHLVIRREEVAWLASICNWGLACGWFSGRDEAIAAVPAFREDRSRYDAYWDRLVREHPERAAVVDADEVRRNFSLLTEALAGIGIAFAVPAGFDGHIDAVPHSPAERDRRVTRSDVLAAIEAA
jgi:hypothetical protein